MKSRNLKKRKEGSFTVIERKLHKNNPVARHYIIFSRRNRNTTIPLLLSPPPPNFRQRNEPLQPVKDHGRSVTPKRIEGRERERELRETGGPTDSEVSDGRGPARCQLVNLSAHARWHRANRPQCGFTPTVFARRVHTAAHSGSLSLSRHALFRGAARISVYSTCA